MLASLLVIASCQTSPADAANEFLGSLTPDARKAAILPFEDEYRTLFRFTPVARKGAFVGEFNAETRTKANDWLAVHLSPSGMRQIEMIRQLEDVLRELENNNPIRDKALYAYTFFGQPTDNGAWGWRYEGHHLSLNYTYRDGKMVSTSPQFLGSSPAEVRTGALKGSRVLAEESDLGFELLKSLTESQRRIAIVGSRTPRSINGSLGFVTNNDRIAKIEGKVGLSFSKMSTLQQATLKKLVEAHADVQRESEVRSRLAKIEKAGWNEVVFAWMGATEPTADHYYRIQGPAFVIEFDNAQDNTNHIHSVWRDFKGDFGRDLLGDHYATSQHHRR